MADESPLPPTSAPSPAGFGERYQQPMVWGRCCGVLPALVIVLCLIAILIPALAPARVQYRHTQCINGLKQMGVYLSLYRDKYGEYPAIGTGTNSWFARIWRPELCTDGNLFRCASRGVGGKGTHYWTVVRPGSWLSSGKSFAFATGKDLVGGPPDLPIACDMLDLPSEHHDGRVGVLYLSGRVENLPADDPFVKSPPAYLGPSGWDAPAGTK